MAITLISGLKQANNGTFALIDSNDIGGGLYHVDTVEEMNELPVERLKIGMLCYVAGAVNKFYQYQKNGDNATFQEWKAGFDKNEMFEELDNRTIINSILANSNTIDNLQKQVDAITGTDEGGDATTIAGLNAQLASLKATVGSATVGETAATGLFKRIEELETSVGNIQIATEAEIKAIIDNLA